MSMSPGKAYPELYDDQLASKISSTQGLLGSLGISNAPNLEVFPSAPSHYRMRAEFKIWQQGETAHYAMFEQGEYKKPILIDEFSIGSKTISTLMPLLIERINKDEILRKRLFQIEFLTTLKGEALVTLIYHKPLDAEWIHNAKQLERDLEVHIIGRSRKQKEVLSKDYVIETLKLRQGEIKYQQVETGFTQPNAQVCIEMLNWASDNTENLGGDLIELYCGNGNFTIPLSYNFERVFATEISKISTRSALHNIALNKRENIEVLRLSSEEVSDAFSGVREFRRLKHLDLKAYNFSTIFVDPPRAGLDPHTLSLVSEYDNIVYISCNPETLENNLKTLLKTHDITKFALFDQFPYTDHRECGVILKRRPSE